MTAIKHPIDVLLSLKLLGSFWVQPEGARCFQHPKNLNPEKEGRSEYDQSLTSQIHLPNAVSSVCTGVKRRRDERPHGRYMHGVRDGEEMHATSSTIPMSTKRPPPSSGWGGEWRWRMAVAKTSGVNAADAHAEEALSAKGRPGTHTHLMRRCSWPVGGGGAGGGGGARRALTRRSSPGRSTSA